MRQFTLYVKERLALFSLLKDVYKTAQNIVKQRRVDIRWLCFAKRTKYGYLLLPNKDQQYETLKDVCKDVRVRHPSYTHGQIADTISILVNTTVKDCIQMHELPLKERPNEEEENFLQNQLLTLSASDHYVPRYPWLMAEPSQDSVSWRAKDLVSNSMVTIQKFQDVNFYKYTITYA